MEYSSIAQSTVIGPVQLTVDASHRPLRMEGQADTETTT
jgi:hypothetical protein